MEERQDLISRQEALRAVGVNSWAGFRINALPSVQPKRKKGEWILYDGDWFKTMYKCSECGAMIDSEEKDTHFFCYHCGARMYCEEDEKIG